MSRWERTCLALLLAVVLLRSWLQPMFSSLWIDEIVTFWPGAAGWGQLESRLAWLPVDHSMAAAAALLGTTIGGQTEPALRAFSLLAALYCLVLLGRIGARWFGPRVGWMAMLLFPCLQAVYMQVANARPYMLLLAFYLTAVDCLDLWLEHGRRRRLLAAALAVMLMPKAHALGAFGFTSLGLLVVFARWRPQRSIPAALTLIPGVLVTIWIVTSRQMSTTQFLKAPSIAALAPALVPQPVGSLVLAGLAAAWTFWPRLTWVGPTPEDPIRLRWLLASFVLPPVLNLFYSISSGVSIFMPRYYLVAFPAVALLLAWLIARIEPVVIRLGLLCLTCAGCMLMLTGRSSIPAPNHEDWRGAIQNLAKTRTDPAEPVIYYPGLVEADAANWREGYQPGGLFQSMFTFYPLPGTTFGLPYGQSPRRIAEVTPELEALFQRHQRLWLLLRGNGGPLQPWIDAQISRYGWRRRSLGEFQSITVEELTPPPR
jgi:hypothetical protein